MANTVEDRFNGKDQVYMDGVHDSLKGISEVVVKHLYFRQATKTAHKVPQQESVI